MKIKFIVMMLLVAACLKAQPNLNGQIKFNLTEDGSHYLKATFLNQAWLRYTQMNPGSLVNGRSVDDMFDIGLRRTRAQFYGQVSDHVFFYTQFGMNNFSYLSLNKQYAAAFFHDVVGEYKVAKQHCSIGAGLTGWSGLSRYASPSIGTTLTLDAPIYQQITNGVNDQFLRKLSVYAKGKLGGLDYRIAVAKPFDVSNAPNAPKAISKTHSDFSLRPSQLQYQAYLMYQFFDKEDNTIPYTVGTYLGTKKVFNIGAGFINQAQAMWQLNNNGDTTTSALTAFAADVFYDTPVNKERGDAFTFYAAFHHLDMGRAYIKNTGVMNPANGLSSSAVNFNGAGNAFPMIGTGNIYYAQAGYLFPKKLLKEKQKLQVVGALQYAAYERLTDAMLMYEAGANLYFHKNNKLSFIYQNRPVYTSQPNGDVKNTDRKGMFVLQYQISI
ncbi:MAG: hypothetical protein ACO3EE_05550 [Flavobacteriales bacterium]